MGFDLNYDRKMLEMKNWPEDEGWKTDKKVRG
jgi:hypothetical protein